MAKHSQETIEKEINEAILADQQAVANYYKAIRSLMAAHLTVPDTKMDATSMKEIDASWIAKENTGKYLRRAFMKLYGSRF